MPFDMCGDVSGHARPGARSPRRRCRHGPGAARTQGSL